MALPMTAFAIVTALLLTVLGGAQTFWTWTDDLGVTYQALAVVALVLLVVPLASLGGAAARLSARRRDDRLATLRLLGATPATVSALAVIEAAVLAFAGAVLGVAVYAALLPALALIPFRGQALGIDGVWLGASAALVPLGVTALAVVSAVVSLRRVVISPLGVRTKQEAPRLHWARLAIGVAVVVLAFGAMAVLQVAPSVLVILGMLAAAFGGTIAVLNLMGPWILRLVTSAQVRRAKTPARLIAARTVLESPKAAWRQVSGVAMTSFMAVFAGSGVAVLDAMGAGAGSGDPESTMLIEDIRTGILITVAGSFLMVACSVGVNQAAGVLDRRDLYRSLDLLGMPLEVMDAARRRAVMSPLRITALGSAVTAAIVMLPLTGITLIVAPLSLVVIAGVLAAGIGVVWLGLRATRPVLERAAVGASEAVVA
ncbi:FtsX-like permease family protein [Agromyces aerolatus]|uniref:FtsX-like permease family protein n=1 Tax=Agromyces sp. LY-1074 TaxID=3074080 RepID=UPI002859E385|nr:MULTISPECIES: FtsX-like permease family protein [unclassified Agromyces]MDR5701680.1 FtsX-like permease family protein [Agromyces sp. LY-1074]